MDLGSIFLILALTIITAAFIVYPLLNKSTQGVAQADIEMSAMLADRDRLLDSLLDLDSDQELGKVSEELYGEQRQILLVQAAEVMAKLDEQMADQVELETMLQDRKGGKAGDTLDEMIAARRNRRTGSDDTAAVFCSECGAGLQAEDKFCVSCGTRV